MANRRNLKKQVKLICGEIMTDCFLLSICQNADEDKVKDLLAEAVDIYNDFISRISHTEPGQEKLFYKKLREDFSARIDALNQKIVKA